MCEYCLGGAYGGHDARCPNAPEEKPVLSCDICWKNNIYAGDDYWDIGGTIVCEECMDKAKKVAESE